MEAINLDISEKIPKLRIIRRKQIVLQQLQGIYEEFKHIVDQDDFNEEAIIRITNLLQGINWELVEKVLSKNNETKYGYGATWLIITTLYVVHALFFPDNSKLLKQIERVLSVNYPLLEPADNLRNFIKKTSNNAFYTLPSRTKFENLLGNLISAVAES